MMEQNSAHFLCDILFRWNLLVVSLLVCCMRGGSVGIAQQIPGNLGQWSIASRPLGDTRLQLGAWHAGCTGPTGHCFRQRERLHRASLDQILPGGSGGGGCGMRSQYHGNVT